MKQVDLPEIDAIDDKLCFLLSQFVIIFVGVPSLLPLGRNNERIMPNPRLLSPLHLVVRTMPFGFLGSGWVQVGR